MVFILTPILYLLSMVEGSPTLQISQNKKRFDEFLDVLSEDGWPYRGKSNKLSGGKETNWEC
jgi:hypothetical protein